MLEHSNIYSRALESLYNYYRNEVNDAAHEIFANHRINNSKKTRSKSFEYMRK